MDLRRVSLLIASLGALLPAPGMAQDEVLHYWALEDRDTGQVAQRGRLLGDRPVTNLFLAQNRRYRFWRLRSSDLWIGSAEFTAPAVIFGGTRFPIPPVALHPPSSHDLDADGLHDLGEHIVGCDPRQGDTDGDGALDAQELRAGSDPLDGQAVRTGAAAGVDLGAAVVDLDVVNDMAAALSRDSIAIVNVFQALPPRVVSRVELPGGQAREVSISGNRVAVAGQRLFVLDVSDRPAARILREVDLGGPARAVVTTGPLAYVGGVGLSVVDMESGAILETRAFTGLVEDVAVYRDFVYVLESGAASPALHVFERRGGSLEQLGSVAAPGNPAPAEQDPRRRIFAGGGRVWSGAIEGWSVFDVSNPATPLRIGFPLAQGRAVYDLAFDGTDRLLAITPIAAGGVTDLSVYDASTPTDVTRLLTAFPARGAEPVALYNGLAYVGVGAGLTAYVYEPRDSLRVPPTISLVTDLTGDPLAVSQGKPIRIEALAQDDVSVARVALFFDGQQVAVDGDFPYEFRVQAPVVNRPSVTISARVWDTGGNSASSEELRVLLTNELAPPAIVSVSPRDGGTVTNVTAVAAFFDEPLDVASVGTAAITLVAAGPDGAFDTGDEITVSGGTVELRAEVNAILLTFPTQLPAERYRAELQAGIRDLLGNARPSPHSWTFRIIAVDDDPDGDGLPSDLERRLGLDPNNPDTNGDGISDGDTDLDGDGLSNLVEYQLGLDPAKFSSLDDGVPDGRRDADGDTLANLDEVGLHGTDPGSRDTDMDGATDEIELEAGYSPTSITSSPIRFAVSGFSVRR